MKKILLSALFILSATSMTAQNSALLKAKEAELMGKWDKALGYLEPALENPKTTKFAEIYRQIGQCYINIFQPELAKAAQGEPFDTLLYCTGLDKAIEAITKSNEADFAADKKGKKGEFLTMNKLNITQMMDFYNYAAQFASMMGENQKSLEYFKKYYELPKHPVFSPEETQGFYEGEGKENYNQALFNIALLSYQLKDWDGVLANAKVAMEKYPKGQTDLYWMMLQANAEKNDSVAYFDVLEDFIVKGGNADVTQNLLYELLHKDKETALSVATNFINKYPNDATPYYVRGYVNSNLAPIDYANAEADYKKALEINPDDLDANLKLAYNYINDVANKVNSNEIKLPYGTTPAIKAKYDKIWNEQVVPYYKNARIYLERVRQLDPENKKHWAGELRSVYRNLKMEDEAKELDPLVE
ncbi:MAG: hypothetical protein IJ816_00290 [Alloprevotella sp.]|nr:hypothetical protein [Alloprevotella sp.]